MAAALERSWKVGWILRAVCLLHGSADQDRNRNSFAFPSQNPEPGLLLTNSTNVLQELVRAAKYHLPDEKWIGT